MTKIPTSPIHHRINLAISHHYRNRGVERDRNEIANVFFLSSSNNQQNPEIQEQNKSRTMKFAIQCELHLGLRSFNEEWNLSCNHRQESQDSTNRLFVETDRRHSLVRDYQMLSYE